MTAALVFMALLFAMSSCTTPKVVTVTEYRDRVTHDTITRVDSVYKAHYVREKGDTVFFTDTVIGYKWLERTRDVYVHDSVPYEVPVQIPVRTRNGYDRFTSWGFWLLLVLLILRVGWWAFKKFYLHK